MKYIRNTMQRPGQWTVIWVKNHREHFVGTYATEAEAQQAAWPNYNIPAVIRAYRACGVVCDD